VTNLPPLHLKACLLADSQQGGIPDPFDLGNRRQGESRQIGDGGDPATDQRLPLVTRYSSEEFSDFAFTLVGAGVKCRAFNAIYRCLIFIEVKGGIR
jgi:hypothetical protein